jgi:hypothetical protein
VLLTKRIKNLFLNSKRDSDQAVEDLIEEKKSGDLKVDFDEGIIKIQICNETQSFYDYIHQKTKAKFYRWKQYNIYRPIIKKNNKRIAIGFRNIEKISIENFPLIAQLVNKLCLS